MGLSINGLGHSSQCFFLYGSFNNVIQEPILYLQDDHWISTHHHHIDNSKIYELHGQEHPLQKSSHTVP